MISSDQLGSIAGHTMHSVDGAKIGKIVDVYESTDSPEGTFVTVHTGLFGGHASFVPLAQAELKGHDVVVPYDKDLVKDAPRVANDERAHVPGGGAPAPALPADWRRPGDWHGWAA